MKKIFDKKTGKEIHIGDVITFSSSESTENSIEHSQWSLTLTHDNINFFVKEGIFEVKEDGELNIDFFINLLAGKLKWSPEQVYNYIDKLDAIYTPLAFSLILKVISDYFDSKYESSIESAKFIYVISTSDGEVHRMDKGIIKNYDNFAGFRCLADAFTALNIVKPYIMKMYGK